MSAETPTSPGPVLLDARDRRRVMLGVGIGVLLTLVAFFVDRAAAWSGLTLAGQFVLGLGLGGLLFIVLGQITSAGWFVAVRRVPEAMAGTLPYGAAVVLGALLLSLGAYEWAHPEQVAGDALLAHKSAWLNPAAVILRTILFLGLWILFARLLRRHSLRQDRSSEPGARGRAVALSCGFMAVFALSFSFASFDWIMSLEAHWYSTVYAIYTFSGMFLAGLAALTILLVWLRRRGPLAGVLRADHLHDLGKLIVGFTTFWAYIWFCQYMLIWYSNIPEETTYYVARMNATWGPWMIMNVVVNWLAPFLLLLPSAAKRSESRIVGVAALLILGRFLDLHLLIAPALTDSPWTLLWSIGPALAAVSGFVWFFARSLSRAPIVAEGDPFLSESLHYHA